MRYPCKGCQTKSEGCFNACPEYKLYQLFADIDRKEIRKALREQAEADAFTWEVYQNGRRYQSHLRRQKERT